VPLTFSHLFPAERDGCPTSYTLKEIHKALILEGYESSYDQVSEAQRTLAERRETHELMRPLNNEGRAYEFSWQAACRIARHVARGKFSRKQQMQAEAIEHLHKFGAMLEYRGTVDMEIIRLLRLIVTLLGGDPNENPNANPNTDLNTNENKSD
jgi:hypothetical protein